MAVFISSNQMLEVVVPGIPGIFILKAGETEIKSRGEFSAKELADGIVRDHKSDRQGLSLTVFEK